MTKKILLDNYKNEIEQLYSKQKLSLKKVGEKIGVSATTIRKNMIKWNFQTRPGRREIIRPLKEDLEELYLNKHLCMEKIADNLKISLGTVFKLINVYGIPIRKFKYNKSDFLQDPHEKAYIKGLAWGDFHVRRHGRQIAVEISTHPSSHD